MSHNKYSIYLIVIVIICLSVVAFTNYTIDPARLYHPPSADGTNSPEIFAKRLLQSKSGLFFPNNTWNERDIKQALVQTVTDADCAVIGSSHVMQISSFSKNKSLTGICRSVINLGVSGGTLEDYAVLAWEITENPHGPKKIIFGVDPWALEFNKDKRWQRYSDLFYKVKRLVTQTKEDTQTTNTAALLSNLLSLDYFLRALNSEHKSEERPVREAPPVKIEVGHSDPILLPDGSLVYSEEYLSTHQKPVIPIGGSEYKINKNKRQYSEGAVLFFLSLIEFLTEKGYETTLLLTPYHHSVWENENSPTAAALMQVEGLLKKISKEKGIKLIGSYSPAIIGCTADQFYDPMHSKSACLAQIAH